MTTSPPLTPSRPQHAVELDESAVLGVCDDRPRWVRFALRWSVPTLLAVLVAVPMLRILFGEGANVVSGDEARPLLQFIDPALRGKFDWSELYDASYQNSSSHLLTYLLYLAVASWFAMDYNVLIQLGLAFAVIRIGLLMLLAREVLGKRSPLLLVLLPVLSAISFSKTNVSNYEFGFIGFPFGLVTSAFILGLWAIVRWGAAWHMLVVVCATGILISLSSGLGPVTWAVYGTLLLSLRLVRWRYVLPILAAILLSATPYYRSLFETGSYRDELASEPFSLGLYLRLLGLPIANSWEHQVVAGAVVLMAVVLVLLPLVRYPRHEWDMQEFAAPLGLVGAGLLMTLLLTVLRGFVVWYYVFTGTLVLFGIALIAVLHLHRLLVVRDFRNPTYVAAGCAVLAGLLLTGSWASANQDHLAKTVFMRWRSPVTESCLRNYDIAPTTCEAHLAPWAPGSNPYFAGLTTRLGTALRRHDLHPFSEDETWRLQGDWMLDRVDVVEHADDVNWVTPRDGYASPFTDHRRLDLQTPAPSSVRWTIDIPRDVSARLRSAVRLHPEVLGTVGADVDVAVARGDEAPRVVWRGSAEAPDAEWDAFDLDLSGYAGSRVAIVLRAKVHGTDGARILWKHPVVDVAGDQSTSLTRNALQDRGATPDASLDLEIDNAASWERERVERTSRRRDGNVEFRLTGSADVEDAAPGTVAIGAPTGVLTRRLPSAPCLDGFTHFAVDMRLEDPWGTGGQGEYAIPRVARFAFTVLPPAQDAVATTLSLEIPYRIMEPDYAPTTDTYLVPLRQLDIPRGSRLIKVAMQPIGTPVPTSTNQASFGNLQLVRHGEFTGPHCVAKHERQAHADAT